jgi:hypothetical protein
MDASALHAAIPGLSMLDESILSHISRLIEKEHQLRQRSHPGDDDKERLKQV